MDRMSTADGQKYLEEEQIRLTVSDEIGHK